MNEPVYYIDNQVDAQVNDKGKGMGCLPLSWGKAKTTTISLAPRRIPFGQRPWRNLRKPDYWETWGKKIRERGEPRRLRYNLRSRRP